MIRCRHNYSGDVTCGLCATERRGGENATDACLHVGMCPLVCGCWCDTCEADRKAVREAEEVERRRAQNYY